MLGVVDQTKTWRDVLTNARAMLVKQPYLWQGCQKDLNLAADRCSDVAGLIERAAENVIPAEFQKAMMRFALANRIRQPRWLFSTDDWTGAVASGLAAWNDGLEPKFAKKKALEAFDKALHPSGQ